MCEVNWWLILNVDRRCHVTLNNVAITLNDVAIALRWCYGYLHDEDTVHIIVVEVNPIRCYI